MALTLQPPALNPAPIFEIFRGNYAMELLTAAVAYFLASSIAWPRGRSLEPSFRRQRGLPSDPSASC
jgi:hypothetical protein